MHLDGYINGNVKGELGEGAFLSVSEQGCIEGSVIAPNVILNGIVKGDIEASERVELGAKARVFGNVHYTIIETAVGAQINGKLIHRANPQAGGAEQAAGAAIRGLPRVNPVPKRVRNFDWPPAGGVEWHYECDTQNP